MTRRAASAQAESAKDASVTRHPSHRLDTERPLGPTEAACTCGIVGTAERVGDHVARCSTRWAARQSSDAVVGQGAWPIRICCDDGTVWDEMPDDVDHAFALIEDYESACGCGQPGRHYVEVSPPHVWQRVLARGDS
jgi:hypothetical protein